MKTRIISALIGFSLLLLLVILGGTVLNIAILIVSLIAVYEFNRVVRNIDGMNPILSVNYVFTICLFLLNYTETIEIEFLIFIYIITTLSFLVFGKKHVFSDVPITLLGGLYIPFFFYHMYLLNDNIYIWIVFIAAFATDTFAYFSGMFFGKHKLCPEISPKKTVEGSIGGIVGSVVTIVIFSIVFKLENILGMAILGVILSVMSQIGDLTASRIKRTAGVKDYGDLMPGHGGVLDRFDSILFTTPIVYYYIIYVL